MNVFDRKQSLQPKCGYSEIDYAERTKKHNAQFPRYSIRLVRNQYGDDKWTCGIWDVDCMSMHTYGLSYSWVPVIGTAGVFGQFGTRDEAERAGIAERDRRIKRDRLESIGPYDCTIIYPHTTQMEEQK